MLAVKAEQALVGHNQQAWRKVQTIIEIDRELGQDFFIIQQL